VIESKISVNSPKGLWTAFCAQKCNLSVTTVEAGPALASTGPDWKDFRGALLVCKKFWGGATSHNRGNHE